MNVGDEVVIMANSDIARVKKTSVNDRTVYEVTPDGCTYLEDDGELTKRKHSFEDDDDSIILSSQYTCTTETFATNENDVCELISTAGLSYQSQIPVLDDSLWEHVVRWFEV